MTIDKSDPVETEISPGHTVTAYVHHGAGFGPEYWSWGCTCGRKESNYRTGHNSNNWASAEAATEFAKEMH